MKKIYQFIGVIASLIGINNSIQAQVVTQTLNFTGAL